MSEIGNQIISEEQFAAIVGWHKETIAQMRRDGKIDHCREGRKIWYLVPEHVDSFSRRFERKAQAA